MLCRIDGIEVGDVDDTLNRYCNYPSPDWPRATYAEAGKWNSLSIESGEVRGFDDKMASMLFVGACKSACTSPLTPP